MQNKSACKEKLY